MRICGRCKKAENPQANLRFVDSPEGALCEQCFLRFYDFPDGTISGLSQEDYVVITCPTCRGRHHSRHGQVCSGCCGYGAVRIAKNALPIFNPPSYGGCKILTEESEVQE